MTARYQEVLRRLYAPERRVRRLGLERMVAACAALGHPERSFEAVHVAGTNGKGTVCAFTAAMALAAGHRVGLYTSPHLCRLAERVRVDGEPLADEALAAYLTRAMDLDEALTFFEVVTLAAFQAFRDAGVRTAVLEVGLGGRLDATNVIPPPCVAAVTRIAFDHMAELGSTLTDIAREKAGIVKPGTKVVVGKLHPAALEVVMERCQEVGAELIPADAEPLQGLSLAYPRPAMLGSNLAVAVTIAGVLGLDADAICEGVEATQWPGRNELLHRNRQDLTLLDCAHNPDGAVVIAHVIDAGFKREFGFESRRDVALVFGAMADKNWRAMLDRLDPLAYHKVYVAPPLARAVPPARLAEAYPGEVAEDVEGALALARSKVGPGGLVVVTGSTYLVGAARAALLGLPTDPPVDL